VGHTGTHSGCYFVLQHRGWRGASSAIALAAALWCSAAAADPPSPPAEGESRPFARATPPDDPTGGAYTSPTLLFIPAAAVPTWNVRVITSLDVQAPTAPDRLASGSSVGLQPGVGGEIGLPGEVTLGAGTIWVGGDTSPAPASGGLSPYLQARLHLLGDKSGRGFQLGTSVTYKFVGFQGDPGEMELAVSAQYRRRYYEVGLQGVFGKDFATTDADAELHGYAVYRPIPVLAVGAATQVRLGVVSQPGEPIADVIAGGIASVTLGRWQVAALGGESTVGLNQGTQIKAGALAEIFGTARF